MASFRFAAVLLAVLLAGTSAPAADGNCLSRQERRTILASGKVVQLAEAIRAIHPPRGEVLRARLCKGDMGFVYRLTLLSQNGKVTEVAVDAVSGRLAGR